MLKKASVVLFWFFATLSAFAQSGASVKQSGNITPNTVPWWITGGVIGGGVTAADSPISSFGATGPICSNSARQASGAWNSLCFQANTNSAATISLQNYGSASAQSLNFNVNGTVYPITPLIQGKPFVILASGQSNFSDAPSFSWQPNPGATLWNFSGFDGNIGTAYTAISGLNISITWSIASSIATANPARRICLINISFAGQAISHWLPGTSSPDVYQNIINNIGPALAACGATKIDLFEWWQGEGDTQPLNLNYIANFTTLMNRFWAAQIGGFNWFPQETPVVIHSIASSAISGNPDGGPMNALLQGVVNADTDKRRYVYTADLSTAAYWDVTNPGHMTGFGYFSAGAMSASAFLNGPGRNSLPNVIVDPASGKILLGNAGLSVAPFAFNQNSQGVLLPPSSAIGQIGGADSLGVFWLLDSFGNFTNYVGRRANGTLAAPSALNSGDLIVGLGAQGHDNANYINSNKASFSCFAAENWSSATNHGTYCSIFSTLVGTDTNKETARFAGNVVTVQGPNSATVIPGDATLTVNNNSGAPLATALNPDLHLVGANSALSGILMDSYGAETVVAARNSAGPPGALAAVGASTAYFGIAAQTYDGFGYTSNAGFDFITANAQTASDHSSLLRLNTTPKGSTTQVEAWRTQPSGGFSVGTTADSGTGTMILKKQAFASLTACSSTIEGAIASITDSSTNTWGATITGSSTNHVMGYCDGTNWTVMGK